MREKRPRVQGSSRKNSHGGSKKGETPSYKKCGKFHFVECKFRSRTCYKCGDLHHKYFECNNDINDEE